MDKLGIVWIALCAWVVITFPIAWIYLYRRLIRPTKGKTPEEAVVYLKSLHWDKSEDVAGFAEKQYRRTRYLRYLKIIIPAGIIIPIVRLAILGYLDTSGTSVTFSLYAIWLFVLLFMLFTIPYVIIFDKAFRSYGEFLETLQG